MDMFEHQAEKEKDKEAPLPVVKYLNVFRNVFNCFPPGTIMAMINQFLLYNSPEALHRRIIKAVPTSTH